MTEEYIKPSQIKGVREKLIEKQNGICQICKRELSYPTLDHDHQTEWVRDVLCAVCNRAEGKIGFWIKVTGADNREKWLRSLLKYWRRHKVSQHGLLLKNRKRRRKKKK